MKKINNKISTIASLAVMAFAGVMCIIIVSFFIGCANAQEQNNNVIKSTEQEDAIIFQFSNVDSIAYIWDDGCFLVWYEDSDCFDYDAMADRAGLDQWYGDFVYLDIEDSLVSEFVMDFHKYIELQFNYESNWEKMDKLSEKWGIVCWSESNECYEIVRMREDSWWFK